jgi:hypothetical protein
MFVPADNDPCAPYYGQVYAMNVAFHPKNMFQRPAQDINDMQPTDDGAREYSTPAIPMFDRPAPLFDNPHGMPYYPGQDLPRYPTPNVQPSPRPRNSDEENQVVPPNNASEHANGEDFEIVSANLDPILGASGSEDDDDDDDDDEQYTPDEDEEDEGNDEDGLDYVEELAGLNGGDQDEDEQEVVFVYGKFAS